MGSFVTCCHPFSWTRQTGQVTSEMTHMNNNNGHFVLNFIYNILLNITSASLTKKAICTWLAYKKNNNKHNNNDNKRAIVYIMLFQ